MRPHSLSHDMMKWFCILSVSVSAWNGNSLNDATEVFGDNLEQLRNFTIWNNMAPNMHIADENFQKQIYSLWSTPSTDDETNTDMSDWLRREGYFQLPPPEYHLPFESMIDVMDKIDALSLPVAFCMLYDEFWLPFTRIHGLMEAFLGPRYLKLPDFWAWRVDHTREERGWGVHVDKNEFDTCTENGLPCTLTIWIPLSDVSADNSCMHILPADRDPSYNTRDIADLADYHWTDFVAAFRALPAVAGSVLGWNSKVYHFGSRSSRRAKKNRYSLAFEYQSAAIPPVKEGTMDPFFLPPYDMRMELVLKAILKYSHMYPLREELETAIKTKMPESDSCAAGKCA